MCEEVPQERGRKAFLYRAVVTHLTSRIHGFSRGPYKAKGQTETWTQYHLWLRFGPWFIAASLATLWPFSLATAATPEYIAAEEPTPESAEDAKQAVTESFVKEVEEPSVFPGVAEKLKDKPPFLRDTKLRAHLRSYYLETMREAAADSEAWALGNTIIDYESGLWKDRLQIGGVLYTSQPLYAPDGKDGTLLLAPGQKGFSVLGQAYLKFKFAGNREIRIGRQALDTPYVNKNDSRMVPNTFESIVFTRQYDEDFGFGFAHTTRIKRRNSDTFEPMSEAAGFPGTDEPLSSAGFRYTLAKRTDFGLFTHYSWNYFNTLYAEATSTYSIGKQWDMRVSGQYTDQRSVGDEIGGKIKTYVYGAQVAASYRGATLNFAFSSTSDRDRIRNPYGGYPGYLSLMLRNHNRAGENAWLIGASYSFEKVGIPALSGFFNYARGNTPDSGSTASPDQEELNLTLDYRFDTGRFKGLWFRLRGALLNQRGTEAADERLVDETQIRFIINLPIQVL